MEYFRYKRRTRDQARKMLIIALGFPVIILGMVYFFGADIVPDSQFTLIGVFSSLVSLFLIFVFVKPDYKKNATFQFVVNDLFVECVCPDSDGYKLQLSEIVGLKQCKSQAGQSMIEDYIETAKGRDYSIPKKYDLNIYRVKKAILAAKPTIRVSNTVRY